MSRHEHKDLIRRARAALYRYQDDPIAPTQEAVREHEGRLYVVLSDGRESVVYRVHELTDGTTTLRIMKRPPREVYTVGK